MAQTETLGVSQQSQLDRLGFTRGNPFATMEADREREILDKLFVDIDNFERIRSARTAIVHAPRGWGKSAVRVRLTNDLAPWTDRPDMDAFAIEFLQFDSLLALQLAHEEITPLCYVDNILRLGAQAIFPFLLRPGQPPNPRLERLSEAGLARLGRLVNRCAGELLAPESVYERFSALLPGVSLRWGDLVAAVNAHQASELLGAEALERSPQARALAFLVDLDLEEHSQPPADPVERLDPLVNLVQRMGFRRLAVMVDRVDEVSQTANNPDAQAALLKPLMSHLRLMEMPGASFMFFIPTATHSVLQKQGAVRSDRLEIIEATIDWSESRLRKLLAKRLVCFGGLPDFSQNTSTRRDDRPDGDESLGEAIEREMVLLAGHSPRRLIRAGQLMLGAYLSRPNADLLTWSDWEAARTEMMADEAGEDREEEPSSAEQKSAPFEEMEQAEPQAGRVFFPRSGWPILHISMRQKRMALKGKEILLSETEAKIIHTLIQGGGTVEQEKLVDEVWNKAISTAGIDVALKRIRDEIDKITGEKKSGLKYYLTKRSGTIMLMNFLLDDEVQQKPI